MPKQPIGNDDFPTQRPQRMLAPEFLLALHEVNERCLDLIALVSKLPPADAPFALVGPLRSLFRGTRSSLRRRLSQQPFALVDMKFRDEEWWRALKHRPSGTWRDRPWRAQSPKRAAIQLAQASLMLAWHMARADAEATRVVFGMTREVAGRIGTLRLSEIEAIAQQQFRHLRPRWENRGEFWREMLAAAHAEGSEATRTVAIRALQLFAGEVLPRS